MTTMFRTIVGGRGGLVKGTGGHPRAIEVLLKKAKVDAGFREQLMGNPIAAATDIGLELRETEKKMLACTPSSTLRLMIDRTFVPRHHVRTFMSRNAPAMLALVLATTVAATAGGSAQQVEKGITAEELPHDRAAVAANRMIMIHGALEAHRVAKGCYPSTEAWITSADPLGGHLGTSNLSDPWGRRFHYQAIVRNGVAVDYCLQSWGANLLDPQDDVADLDASHQFPAEKPIILGAPQWESDGRVTFSAKHEDAEQAVEWYLDAKKAGRTVGTHRLAVDMAPLGAAEHVLLVVDESGHFATLAVKAPTP